MIATISIGITNVDKATKAMEKSISRLVNLPNAVLKFLEHLIRDSIAI